MTNETMKAQTPKPPKSVALTSNELKKLKAYRKMFKTEVEAAISIGIDGAVLNRIIVFGSGSFRSIEKIRQKLDSL